MSVWLGSRTESDEGAVRKLNNVLRELELLAEQGKAVGFFNNIDNADKLWGLVEDIRDAVMDYQVRNRRNYLTLACLTPVPDSFATRSLRQELPTHREDPFLLFNYLQ